MSFKFKRTTLPGIAHGGTLNKKHKFKVKRTELGDGVLGEAKMDGSVEVDKSVKPGSKLDKKIQRHEGVHAREIKSGRIAYGDDWVRSDGKTYPRKDGKIKYNGKWKPEGDSSFPWEKRAKKAEKNV
jgi:hypothetical protein|tara:strand:- start:92 stop:472 length:381 start_codon:yes stop_codon:yes gene_type:complete